MTTRELQRDPPDATFIARVRATPAGEISLTTIDTGAAAYGPVEIAWYSDRLQITACDAGRALITKGHLKGEGKDLIVEIRPPA
jgi:hypothetical protein